MPSDLDILRGASSAPPPSARKRRDVLEDMNALTGANAPADPPAGSGEEPLERFRRELRTAAPSMTLAEVDRVVKLAEKLLGDAAESEEAERKARENATDAGSDRRESEHTRLKNREAAREVCESLGFTPNALELKAIANTAPEDRRAVAKMLRDQRRKR